MKLKNLTELARTRIYTEQNISYQEHKDIIASVADDYGFEHCCYFDQITTGGFAGELFGEKYDCLQIIHPDHEYDYYNYYITLTRQGKTILVVIYAGGTSKQIKKAEFQQNTRVFDGTASRGVASGLFSGGAVGAGLAIGSIAGGALKSGIKAVAKGINALTWNQGKLNSELEWYNQAMCVFSTIFASEE